LELPVSVPPLFGILYSLLRSGLQPTTATAQRQPQSRRHRNQQERVTRKERRKTASPTAHESYKGPNGKKSRTFYGPVSVSSYTYHLFLFLLKSILNTFYAAAALSCRTADRSTLARRLSRVARRIVRPLHGGSLVSYGGLFDVCPAAVPRLACTARELLDVPHVKNYPPVRDDPSL